MVSFSQHLSHLVGQAFAAQDLPTDLGATRVSDRPDLAPFQCNGAMAAAKLARKPPRDVANAVVDHLSANQQGLEASVAGPGFINLHPSPEMLAGWVDGLAGDEAQGVVKDGQGRTVIIDYGGPNVAKPMHVGHLRATIIGDSIKRLFRHAGYEAIGDIHMGDWGLPMGMLISEIAERRPDLPYFDPDAIAFPTEPPVSLDDLVELYPQAAAACKESEQRAESARLATAELQSGRAGYRALWRHFIDLSVAALKQDFGELGVAFELWKGEADADPLLAPMVEDLRRKGIAEKSDGAIIVQVTEPEDKTDIPPLILLKSDGSANYATTDVATIVDRMNSYSPVAMLYVVDQRQALHFEQVFRTVRRGALVAEDTLLEFVGFGTMNGPDGKPFRTRAGGVMRLADLIGMAVERARDRLAQEGLGQDYPQEEQEQIAHRVGIAALKFADLQSHRQTNYVFDIDRFTAFEGKTGPYLLYAAVRIKSLLKRAGDQGLSEGPVQPMQGQDAALAMVLGEFPSAFASALDKRAPSELCDHAYQLCQAFSRFYAECHILSESDAGRQSGWLRLSSLTLRQLETTLNLLGIEVPDRM